MRSIRKANNFLILLLIVVIMISVFLIQGINKPVSKPAAIISPTPTASPTAAAAVETNIPANATVESRFTLTGKIDNTWLFEGQFQAKLVDSQGKELWSSPIVIDPGQEWTSPGFKSFSTKIDYQTKDTHGAIIMSSDNPSGLPENQKTYTIPVQFNH